MASTKKCGSCGFPMYFDYTLKFYICYNCFIEDEQKVLVKW